MARKWFKDWWTRIVPRPLERSTYVLFSSVALILLFWQWQPLGGVVWSIEEPFGRLLLRGLFAFGWTPVLVSTFLINHFDLFGLRQVWLYLRGLPYTTLQFGMPGPYRLVRHPLYVGWLFAFWSTPTMTLAHLLFLNSNNGLHSHRDSIRRARLSTRAWRDLQRLPPFCANANSIHAPPPGFGVGQTYLGRLTEEEIRPSVPSRHQFFGGSLSALSVYIASSRNVNKPGGTYEKFSIISNFHRDMRSAHW